MADRRAGEGRCWPEQPDVHVEGGGWDDSRQATQHHQVASFATKRRAHLASLVLQRQHCPENYSSEVEEGIFVTCYFLHLQHFSHRFLGANNGGQLVLKTPTCSAQLRLSTSPKVLGKRQNSPPYQHPTRYFYYNFSTFLYALCFKS